MTPDEIRQIRETIDRRSLQGTTHYEDCWREHLACAAIRLCDALEAERRIAEAKDAVVEAAKRVDRSWLRDVEMGTDGSKFIPRHALLELSGALRRLAEAEGEGSE